MERLRHIESRIAQIDAEGELSVDDVIMRSEPAQRLLFLEANGYTLAGPSREVFLQPPRLDRMEDSVVEMRFPVAKIASA